MIIKSYILENDPKKTFNEKSILFYGVNIGLKRHFKNIFKQIKSLFDFSIHT